MSMACVQFKFKMWWKTKKACEPQDYVYMNWEFKKDCPSTVGNVNIEGAASQNAEVVKLENLPSKSKFENIHSWLETQSIESYNSISCDSECNCCESDDVHYACVDVTQMSSTSTDDLLQRDYSSRQFSESSLLSCESFSSDSLSDESYYSLQIRKKSKTIFR